MSDTPFVETEILLAVMRDDTDRAASLASDMSGLELRILEDQLDVTIEIIREARKQAIP